MSLIQTELFARNVTRVIIQEPPRHGKSESSSHYFPAWWLGNAPDEQVILASYSASYAAKWGRKARDTFKEHAPSVFGRSLHPSLASISEWGIAGCKGTMSTAGMGGSLTGRGADLLIVDDPVKNAEEAMSSVVREKHWDWWTSTAYSRLEPGGVAMVIQTRWHEDDLAGRLLKQMREGGEHWTLINMPAVAEDDENWSFGDWSWSRKRGQALWPTRYDLRALARIKRVQDYWWPALYQQRPQPRGGNIFKRKWFRYFVEEKHYYVLRGETDKRIPKDVVTRFLIVDPAASLKTTADYTAVGHFGLCPDGELILLDMMRDRMSGPDQIDFIDALFDRWQPSFIGIESVAYQIVLIQALSKRRPCKAIMADKDKVSRALVLSSRMGTSHFYMRANAQYLTDFEDEMLNFPKAKHDDMVDVAAYAAIEAMGIREPQIRVL